MARWRMRISRNLAARCHAGVESGSRRSHRINLACEPLEERRLLSVDAAGGSLTQITAKPNLNVVSLASTGPTGMTPQQVRGAYGIDQITFSSGTITGNGAGQT